MVVVNIQFALLAETCSKVQGLIPITEEIRGHKLRNALACEELSRLEYTAQITSELEKEVSALKLQSDELLFKAFHIIPKSFPYVDCYYEQRTSVSGAYYDPVRHTIVLPAFKTVSDDILVHEITHAIQEDHFHLHRRSKELYEYSDLYAGWNSLVEGDAIVVQESFIEQTGYTLPSVSQSAKQGSDCAPPENVVKWLLFPYSFGRLLALKLIQGEGFSGIDKAYKHHYLPTTRDVMHRELINKSMRLPKVSASVAIMRKVLGFEDDKPLYVDSLGLYMTRLLLGVTLNPSTSLRAAKGWSYDQIFFFKNDSHGFVWETTWETNKEAEEFLGALILVTSKLTKTTINPSASHFLLSTGEGEVWSVLTKGRNVVLGYSK